MGGSNQMIFLITALFVGQGDILGQGSATWDRRLATCGGRADRWERQREVYCLCSLANDTRSGSLIDAARYPRLRYPASRLIAIFASIGSFPST